MTYEVAVRAYRDRDQMFRAGVTIRVDHFVRLGYAPKTAFLIAVKEEIAGFDLP